MSNDPIYYAGIGSRQTPPFEQNAMTDLATLLQNRGLILRSGGAEGADQAFERGIEDGIRAEIFLPWRGFGNTGKSKAVAWDYTACAAVAAEHHPAWDRLPQSVQQLMARNTAQVLGPAPGISTPSRFVICWAPGGVVQGKGLPHATYSDCDGGTGQAVRIAFTYGIPVFNLHDGWSRKALARYLRALFTEQAATGDSPMSISIFCLDHEGELVPEHRPRHPGDMNLCGGRFITLMTPLIDGFARRSEEEQQYGTVIGEGPLMHLQLQLDRALRDPQRYYAFEEDDVDAVAYLWRRLRSLRRLVHYTANHGYILSWA